MNYKVVIPTAGTGSRLEEFSKNINKALVSIDHKPGISYIIEKFPDHIEFVIPVGYKKQSVIDFLTIAYPQKKFTFVDVDIYEGEGSGLGYTLLQCEKELQCPFIFCSNDTLVLESIPEPSENWMGWAEVLDTSQYRTINLYTDVVKDILAKGAKGDVKAYIGLAGIKDYKDFWNSMSSGKKDGSHTIGESYGLKKLIKQKVSAKKFTWFDTGNKRALEQTREFFNDNKEINVLDKDGEAIWFVGEKVIKFSIDEKFISDRVSRAKKLTEKYVPKINSSNTNMYSYNKVSGSVIAKSPNDTKLKSLLNWLETFWTERNLSKKEVETFQQVCSSFYKDKTFQRVSQYFERFEENDEREIVNGVEIPKVFEMLEAVDWKWMSEGKSCQFHGDLHYENILETPSEDEPFSLLDWRQNFGGIEDYGDIYYDLAKLNHGFIVSHEIIRDNLFSISGEPGDITFDLGRKNSLVKNEVLFYSWLEERNFDVKKVKVLTALIFLNIATLHHYPYSKLLFYLGKSMLFEENKK